METNKTDVTARIKTFEDACIELGIDAEAWLKENEKMETDVLAYLKLRIICKALNEGWKPEFTEDEWRYSPRFCLWTEQELSKKSDEWKDDRHLVSTDAYAGDYAGFSYVCSHTEASDSNTDFGSRLCLKNEALAKYCGKQFISLWADFNLIKKGL